VQSCRKTGAGAQCAACGHVPPDLSVTDPLLTQMCSPSTETKMCPICEDNHCCHSYDACHNDAACMTLESCVKVCANLDGGNPDLCTYDCYTSASKSALAEFSTLLTCVVFECLNECANGGDPCTNCTIARCQESKIACGEDADCTLITECGALCATGDSTCLVQCRAMYPAGQDKYDAFTNCGLAACSTVCG
jgi:hypothetical protein